MGGRVVGIWQKQNLLHQSDFPPSNPCFLCTYLFVEGDGHNASDAKARGAAAVMTVVSVTRHLPFV